MGRGKQFKKDRLYITQTEWTESFGGKKKDKSKAYDNLQFTCCNLSLQPWTDPVCTPEGAIFDLVNVIPWIRKYKVNPVTGKPMATGDLVSLKFEKNSDATRQVFTDHTHIVAIKTTGNVYSYKAVDTLNIKPRRWTEIQTGEPFTRADIIVLQDPQHPELHDSKTYYFIKNNLTARKKEVQSSDPLSRITMTTTSERIFKEMKQKEEIEKQNQQLYKQQLIEQGKQVEEEKKEEKPRYRGSDAGSFTSTDFTPKPAEVIPWKAKKTTDKGYVRLVTNMGNINIQLHCDLAPLACENFITHCGSGYYNGTIFHRNIRHFMIQGGDPEGTGSGGKSIWGRPFPDEFNKSLRHDGEGVVSMANRGKDTNGSQFFILYKSAPHLNDKHTVFGKVVGGKDLLKQLALVETDDEDKPKKDIVLIEAFVYKNPFDEEEMKKQEIIQKEKEKKEKESKEYGTWLSNPTAALAPELGSKVQSNSALIGKYIKTEAPPGGTAKKRSLDFGLVTQSTQKKRKTGYGDFSNF